MGPTLIQIVFLTIFTTLASALGPTKIYINQVPAYSNLATCAEPEVSTIVRNMYYGCGDGSRTTSYACFCYQSSSKFSSMIEHHVSTACPDDSSQKTLAVKVFGDYCQLGEIAAVATETPNSSTVSPSPTTSPSLSQAGSTSTSPSPSASPASTPATVFITTTPTPTPGPGSEPSLSPKTSTPTAVIVAGVSIPIVIIILGIVCFLLYRRRSEANRGIIELSGGDRSLNTSHEFQAEPVVIHELKQDCRVEIGESERRLEAPNLSKEAQRYELDSPKRQW